MQRFNSKTDEFGTSQCSSSLPIALLYVRRASSDSAAEFVFFLGLIRCTSLSHGFASLPSLFLRYACPICITRAQGKKTTLQQSRRKHGGHAKVWLAETKPPQRLQYKFVSLLLNLCNGGGMPFLSKSQGAINAHIAFPTLVCAVLNAEEQRSFVSCRSSAARFCLFT